MEPTFGPPTGNPTPWDFSESTDRLAQPAVRVVEDDRDIRDSLIEMLEDHGYRAVGASNGREALDVLHRTPQPPCVILLDLMMPVMDGVACAQALRTRCPEVPVVIISADANVHRVGAVGARAVLSKPFGIDALLAEVAAAIGRR